MQLTPNTKIAVLMGGPGSERAVSLVSGRAVAEALREAGFTAVTEVDVQSEDFQLPAGTELAYNVIHGTFGEDGGVQRILQEKQIPYTGAGVACSENCFDKLRSKSIMASLDVPTPKYEVLDCSHALKMPSMSLPFVVKPPCEGSSVGVHLVHNAEDIGPAICDAVKYGDHILVEELIVGKELTVGILNGLALPVIHICPRSGFYDISNKYPWMNLGGGTDYICPADLDEETTRAVQEAALAAYNALEVEVYARVDVLLQEGTNEPFVLEINTIPGMTSSSLLPKAAQAVGISYPELCSRIAQLSLRQTRT